MRTRVCCPCDDVDPPAQLANLAAEARTEAGARQLLARFEALSRRTGPGCMAGSRMCMPSGLTRSSSREAAESTILEVLDAAGLAAPQHGRVLIASTNRTGDWSH